MSPYLSVIIPAYNEEKRINKTLKIVWDYLSRQGYSWEIVVVVDGARDDTASLVKAFMKGKEDNTGVFAVFFQAYSREYGESIHPACRGTRYLGYTMRV